MWGISCVELCQVNSYITFGCNRKVYCFSLRNTLFCRHEAKFGPTCNSGASNVEISSLKKELEQLRKELNRPYNKNGTKGKRNQ